MKDTKDTFVWENVKPSTSTLITKVLFAKLLGFEKIEHLGWTFPLNHLKVRLAVKECLKALGGA